jgi:tetrahydromethanopterin S-methyltransferase subunit D
LINRLLLLLSLWAGGQRAALSTRSGMSTAVLRVSAGAFWTGLCLAHDSMADITNKCPDA